VLADVHYEAAYLRGALLVGVMHERDVPAWAESLIHTRPDLATTLADVSLTPVELSPMREALWPLAKGVDAHRIGAALLTAAALEKGSRAADDRIRVLGHIRSDFTLPKEVAAAIKSFENRRAFAAVGVRTVTSPTADELTTWLDRVHAPGFFRFDFDAVGEAAAFAAAVSRKIDRDRPAGAAAWFLRGSSGNVTIVLNEFAWQIAAREFSPPPVRSRIPHADAPARAPRLFDESSGGPLSAADAAARIATPHDDAESDHDVFRRAMADVVPLETESKRHVAKTSRVLPPRSADAPPPADDESEDFAAAGIDRRELRRLRRGDYSVEARLDLHGMTVREASAAVHRFVQNSRHAQRRCVCIVHGKGQHSERGTSALRGPVRGALKTVPGVLAFASAPADDGGSGAVYVLLRRK
jgi:DNA-nicking Smr family endonuclease